MAPTTPTEQGFDPGPEIPMAESAGQMGKAGQGLEKGHDARVAKAQGGGLGDVLERPLQEHVAQRRGAAVAKQIPERLG
jgi:hypothetical protein